MHPVQIKAKQPIINENIKNDQNFELQFLLNHNKKSSVVNKNVITKNIKNAKYGNNL
jgi:hypothetical protein